MKHVVLGYPEITPEDYQKIQGIRRAHDSLVDVVEPHFTFIFPTEKLGAFELAAHVRSRIGDMGRIAVALTRATVVEDDSGNFYHTFLIPTEGGVKITALHGRLYTGEMESELRKDIPFVPHVGVGRNPDKTVMEELARTINSTDIGIRGFIDNITIASFDGKKVVDIENVPLEQ